LSGVNAREERGGLPHGEYQCVSLGLSPAVSAIGMVLRYRVDLLDREGRPAVHMGDTTDLVQARQVWRKTADECGLPAVATSPQGEIDRRGKLGPPPDGIRQNAEGAVTHVTIRRAKLEYLLVFVVAAGLGAILVLGEVDTDNLFFMALALGLLGYAVIGGLSSQFIDVADNGLTFGLRTFLGEFGRIQMPASDIDIVLWGRAENRPGGRRAAVAIAAGDRIKTFDRLTEDQARWLTQFLTSMSGR
jgi:hypothetical protein